MTEGFAIGIDINRAGSNLEVLELFEVDIAGTTEFRYTGPTPLALDNNGTGFSDNRLLGIDLTPFSDGDSIVFHAEISNATDGRENFFIIPGSAAETRTLTLQKILDPSGDGGLFDIAILCLDFPVLYDDQGEVLEDASHGDFIQIEVEPQAFVNVQELAGTNTSLGDYTTILSCTGDGLTDPGGAVTIKGFTIPEGEGGIACTFTNTLIAPDERELILTKILEPINDGGTFDLRVDTEVIVLGAGHNDSDSTTVTVDETVIVDEVGEGETILDQYASLVSCTGDGVENVNGATTVEFTIPAGDGAITCTFTNEFQAIIDPPSGDGIITCGLGAVTPLVRAEGIAELLGDILITCHTIPAGAIPDSDGYIEVNVTGLAQCQHHQ